MTESVAAADVPFLPSLRTAGTAAIDAAGVIWRHAVPIGRIVRAWRQVGDAAAGQMNIHGIYIYKRSEEKKAGSVGTSSSAPLKTVISNFPLSLIKK